MIAAGEARSGHRPRANKTRLVSRPHTFWRGDAGQPLHLGVPPLRVRATCGQVRDGRGQRGPAPTCAGDLETRSRTRDSQPSRPYVCGRPGIAPRRPPPGGRPAPTCAGDLCGNRSSGHDGSPAPTCAGDLLTDARLTSRLLSRPYVCGRPAIDRIATRYGAVPPLRVRATC